MVVEKNKDNLWKTDDKTPTVRCPWCRATLTPYWSMRYGLCPDCKGEIVFEVSVKKGKTHPQMKTHGKLVSAGENRLSRRRKKNA